MNDSFHFWFGKSQVVDKNGHPKIVYHGTGSEITAFHDMVWASVTPDLAQEYACMRQFYHEGAANIMPLYMRIERPFNVDLGLSKSVTIGGFFNAALEQAIDAGRNVSLEKARVLLDDIQRCAVEEESGPHYSREDFWYEPETFFGAKGAKSIKEMFHLLGFDGIMMFEAGELTYGAFSAEQVKTAMSFSLSLSI